MRTFTAREKADALKRELFWRRKVYPERVRSRRMTKEQMDWQVAVVEAMIADYEAQIPQQQRLPYAD